MNYQSTSFVIRNLNAFYLPGVVEVISSPARTILLFATLLSSIATDTSTSPELRMTRHKMRLFTWRTRRAEWGVTGRRDGVMSENKVRMHSMNVDGMEGGEGVIPSRCSCRSSGSSVFPKTVEQSS